MITTFIWRKKDEGLSFSSKVLNVDYCIQDNNENRGVHMLGKGGDSRIRLSLAGRVFRR